MAKTSKMKNRHSKTRGRQVKRWAKGHSSDSNPTVTKHRDMAASSRFTINFPSENDNLDSKPKSARKIRFKLDNKELKTESMMRNLTLDEGQDNNEISDQESLASVETAETKFSRFTNCTNPTFNKVHRLWKSGSELQNDVLTVLAAITEVIKAAGGQESEVEYFAALGGSLMKPDQEINTLAATVYLLSLVIRRVPYNVLIKSYMQISTVLYSNLVQYAENEQAHALVRYSIDCLGIVLKAQPDQIFETPGALKIFECLLHFTLDDRPRIRKTAQKSIVNLLKHDTVHPTAKLCAKFTMDTLEKYGINGKENATGSHALNFMSQSMPNMAALNFKACAESMLQFCTVCSQQSWREAIGCLRTAIGNCSPRAECFPLETNLRLIAALYDFLPENAAEIRSKLVWSQCQFQAHRRLADFDALTAGRASMRLLQHILEFMASADQATLAPFVDIVKQSFTECFGDELSRNESISSIVATNLKSLMSLKYFSMWPQCFDIMVAFFKTTKLDSNGMKDLLKSLGELRQSDNFSHLTPLEKCLGVAIRELGPELILRAIPLRLDAADLGVDPANSWLLPLLCQNISGAPLKHFVATFLPVAMQLRKQLAHGGALMPQSHKRILETVQQQLWELLPAYCQRPVDVAENLKDVAKIMASLLSETPTLRPIVLSCLRNLILKSSASAPTEAEMIRYAPNYLPLLFRLFLNDSETEKNVTSLSSYDPKAIRLSCLETIRIYFKIIPASLIGQYLDVALGKLSDEAEIGSNDRRHRVLDLLIAMVRYLEPRDVQRMFDTVKVYCSQTKDKSLQKKAYRVLEEAFNGESNESAEIFFNENKESVMEMLQLELSKASPSTKASKIRCLTKLFENKFLESGKALAMLPEIILCLKEDNVKTRRSAAIFFITISNLIVNELKNVQEGAEKLFQPLTPLLRDAALGSARQKSCVLIAARLFVFEFKQDTPSSLIGQFVGLMTSQLLKQDQRMVVQTSLEFLKTLIACSSQIALGQFLELILQGLFSQTENCQHHFRFLTRKILAKLLRKIPYELVKKYVPEQFQKQLNNVRKALQRYEKQKTLGYQKSTHDDPDDDVISGITGLSKPETIADLLRDTDDENDDKPDFDRKSKKSHKKSDQIFLKQDDDDEILDLLDKKSVRSVQNTTSRTLKSMKHKNHGFELDDTGRIVVVDLEEKEKPELGKRKTEYIDVDDKSGLKRKKTGLVDDDVDGDSDLDDALHYRPGGSGIHRDTKEEESVKWPKKKKTQGDVTKKGCKVQPYSYIPLDFKQLNKRKKKKSEGTYKNLVHGAKKGAMQGGKKKNHRKLKRV